MKVLKVTLLVLIVAGALYTGCQKDCAVVVPVVVDAGSYDTVKLPGDTLTLTGMVKSGATSSMTYLWTVISGPGVPVFDNNAAAVTRISSLEEGRYVLQFQATNDKGETGLDTTSIIVKKNVTTLLIQPTGNHSEVVMTSLNNTDQRTGYSPESFVVSAWTSGGLPYSTRMAVKFDLSSIPANATIVSADLYLYSNPTPDNGNQVAANFGTDNSMLVQRITTPWDSTNVSFHTPPSVTNTGAVTVPSTDSPFLDVDIDVKDLVTTMISQQANYGFYVKLNNEVIYTDRCFVSSYNVRYPDKHPKLVVVYR